MPTLRQLGYLVTLADAPSFVQAARVANVSQPTLSQQIKALEQQMYQHARDLEFEAAANVRDQLRKLKEELVDSPEISIQKNSEVFERRFRILQRDIAADMNKIVEREGDRVIDTVLAGPHEKILDPVCFLPCLSQNSNIDMTMFRTCTRSGRTW